MQIDNLKEKQKIIENNITEMNNILKEIKKWPKEQLEKYLAEIILQNIKIKKNLLKEINKKLLE